ncbi:MAG: HD-GYP domain-containing protein [Deltaproteobacteria bacterium]|jgi:HD-GYP domain-containing protein (c-di-GMP phosphodiesterase class II)|nr:HD-GYP domain-containing protein [Deltaproteobacteria bacterium]
MYKKISTKKLQPGMYIVDTGIPWLDNPYLYSADTEVTEALVKTILNDGFLEVYIDPDRSQLQIDYDALEIIENPPAEPAAEPDAQAEESAPATTGYPMPDIPILAEMDAARNTYVCALEQAQTFMDGIRRNDNVDLRKAKPLVDDMLKSLGRNQDALMSLCKLRSRDDYTYSHCVNVSVLGAAFARHMGFPPEIQHAAGMAGIFHDLGKAQVPLDILNAPRALTEQEFAFLRKHPRMGYEQVKKTPGFSQDILMGVYDHHERFNGHGYPRGVSGEAVSVTGRILAIADVYDALSSNRSYKEAIVPHRVLGIMYQMRGEDFFPGYMEHFIRMLGIYPAGSVVEMQDGTVGVITGSNSATPTRPRVLIVRDAEGYPCRPVEIDTNLPEVPAIQRCLTPAETDVDATLLLGVY